MSSIRVFDDDGEHGLGWGDLEKNKTDVEKMALKQRALDCAILKKVPLLHSGR